MGGPTAAKRELGEKRARVAEYHWDLGEYLTRGHSKRSFTGMRHGPFPVGQHNRIARISLGGTHAAAGQGREMVLPVITDSKTVAAAVITGKLRTGRF